MMVDMLSEPIYPPTRGLARTQGSTLYLTGKPCPYGHTVPRYTSNGACSECLGARVAQGLRGELPPRKCRKCRNVIDHHQCAKCRKILSRNWRTKNRAKLAAIQLKRASVCRDFVRELKGTSPCVDCKTLHPWFVMEFDHINGIEDGDVRVAALIGQGNLERVKLEITKCELVCANCHRVRTHERAVKAGSRKP